MDIVAAVLAHMLELNLGLRHINSQYKLMNSTIYEGYLESDQVDTLSDERFTHRFFAQIGAPELVMSKVVATCPLSIYSPPKTSINSHHTQLPNLQGGRANPAHS